MAETITATVTVNSETITAIVNADPRGPVGGGGGASDVSQLTTTGLTAGNMLRVKTAGGLEERTPAEVRADIGAVGFSDVLPVLIKVKNVSGGSLAKGTPVYISGAVGDNDIADVSKARADDPAKAACALLSQPLLNNFQGTAHVIGQMTSVWTNALGTIGGVYLAPAGGLTRTRPTDPSHIVQWLGTVERISATGVINVNVTSPHKPDEAFFAAQECRSAYTAPYLYIGRAAVGTAESAAAWTIKRQLFSGTSTITITTATGVAWTDRLDATYT